MNTSRIDHESEATPAGLKAARRRHTPGPWVIEDIRQSRIEITTATDEIIADVYAVWTDETTADEARQVGLSNAALIAAAPDLFAVLAAIVDEIDRRGLCLNDAPRLCAIEEGLIVQAMAALEKAGGGAV